LQLWLRNEVAKPDRVYELQLLAAAADRHGHARGGGGGGDASSDRGLLNGLGMLADFNGLTSKHGVFESAWHDEDWQVACKPFVDASAAAERSGAAPLLVELPQNSEAAAEGKENHQSLGKELQLLSVAAMVAAGIGRPFRAKVPRSMYGSRFLNGSAHNAEWKILSDTDGIGGRGAPFSSSNKGEHIVVPVQSVAEAVGAAAKSSDSTILFHAAAANPWACDTAPSVRHQDQSAAGNELVALLAHRLEKFGWDLVKLPLTKTHATACVVRQLFAPSAEMLREVDSRLDAAVDVEGAGLVLGIHVGPDNAQVSSIHQRLACASEMTATFRRHSRSSKPSVSGLPNLVNGHNGREVAWIVVGGGADAAEVAVAEAGVLAQTAAAMHLANGGMHSAHVPPPVVITPASNSTMMTAWLGFYLLSESHACTTYRHDCESARLACIGSVRRNLVSGLMLEAIAAPTPTGRGKEPQCTHWHRNF
jgi:hypothetical protein